MLKYILITQQEKIMDDIRNVSESGRNSFEKILYSLPLFKGYLERENRRESDRILREYIVKNLLNLKETLLSLTNPFLKKFGLEIINEVNNLVNEVEALKNKIEFAPHGYSGFFDTVKIDIPQLDYVYQLDSEILSLLDDLSKKVSPLGDMPDKKSTETLLKNILLDLKNIVKKFDERNNFLKGIR